MAFLISNNTVYSFAEYIDVTERDQRLFDSNEGLTEEVVENILVRSTERILNLLRASDWWVSYYRKRNTETTIASNADIPPLDAIKIIERHADFTDLCVYYGLYNYILPKIADFGTESNAERNKISYYQQKFDTLFNELIEAGDWYDFDASGTVTTEERQQGVNNLRRVR